MWRGAKWCDRRSTTVLINVICLHCVPVADSYGVEPQAEKSLVEWSAYSRVKGMLYALQRTSDCS